MRDFPPLIPRGARRCPLAFAGLPAAPVLLFWFVLSAVHGPAAPARADVSGEILMQDLQSGQGYTVIHVWGSHYDMGYAHGYLLADYVQLAFEEFSGAYGYWWNMARGRVAAWTFLPLECEDEFQGMLDGVRAMHPETTMDVLDLKAASTMGDWLYAAACRSTCCWDELVAPPYTTLAMRKLQFMQFPPQVTQQWHHVVCAWEPTDGSPRWVNFGFPSYVSAVTGANEYGTLASLHDWNSNVGPYYADALPRTMACRYVLTLDLGPDPATHLQAAYDALHPYRAATGGFLNYYVPDGGAGVIKHSKSLGFYAVRTPRPEWMDAQVIDTNNSDIDGTYGVEPWAPYYLSLDPDHGVYATMAGLWQTGYQSTDMHRVALGFREPGDMTLWFDGRLESGTTGRVELEWRDLFREAESVSAPEAPPDHGGPGLADAIRDGDAHMLPARPNPCVRSSPGDGIELPVVLRTPVAPRTAATARLHI